MAESPPPNQSGISRHGLEAAGVGPTFEELRTSEKLPSPNGVALEIMRLTAKPDATLQEVVSLVQLDPALTGRLIEFANTAHSGARRPVAAVIDAAALLGMGTVRQFALSLSVVNGNLTGACREFGYQTFWTGSLARAVAAQAVTMRERTVPPAEAFTCALLSEIGRLALASVYPEEYSGCLAELRGANDDALCAAERERFSIDHRQMTLGLLRDWGFPGVLLDAATLHQESARPLSATPSRSERFAVQLAFAALLGRFCAAADENERAGLLPMILQKAQTLGFSEADLTGLWGQVSQDWQISSRLLNIPSVAIPPLIATGSGGEAGAANAEAGSVRVLLVINDAPESERLRGKLLAEGHVVTQARLADEALECIVRDLPQVILVSDAGQPCDGIELCRSLRAFARDRCYRRRLAVELAG